MFDNQKILASVEKVFDNFSDKELDLIQWYYGADFDYIYDECFYGTGVDVKYGCSKLVLFIEELPSIVVKIPFCGTRDMDYVYSEDNDEDDLICVSESHFCQSSYCEDFDSGDYCWAEAYLYDVACKRHIENFFPETYYIGKVKNIPIYAAERAANSMWAVQNQVEISDSSKQIAKKLSNKCYSSYCDIDSDFFVYTILPILIEQYGEKATNDLIDFIEEYNLGDFHSSNIAFTSDNKIKLIDFSNFFD